MNKLLAFFCLLVGPLHAQIKHDFINHLAKNRLQQEHYSYLYQLNTEKKDSVNYYKARYHLQYFNDSLFKYHYFESFSISSADTILFQKANCIYFTINDKMREEWFTHPQNMAFSDKRFSTLYSAAINSLSTDVTAIPLTLQSSFLSYQKSCGKKPVVGALLSAVMPGMGLYYAGRKKSAWNVLGINLIYAAQIYEAVHVLGVKHPFSLISIGIASIFYASNIYGGFTEVNKVKKERKIQYYNEVSNYYYTPSIFDLQ